MAPKYTGPEQNFEKSKQYAFNEDPYTPHFEEHSVDIKHTFFFCRSKRDSSDTSTTGSNFAVQSLDMLLHNNSG